jgi:hypothetical protein
MDSLLANVSWAATTSREAPWLGKFFHSIEAGGHLISSMEARFPARLVRGHEGTGKFIFYKSLNIVL